MTVRPFYDGFTGSAGTPPDPAVWTARTGNWKPGVQNYTTGAALLDGNSHLAVIADRDGAGGFTSARIDTRGKLDLIPPVRVRASIKMPTGGQGVVPALWTLGDNRPGLEPDWPECGEIDIVEWQSNHPVQDAKHAAGRYASITVHGPTLTAPHLDRPMYRTDRYGPVRAMGRSALDDGFHLYDLIWKPDRMLFAVDGNVAWDLKATDYTAAGGDWTPFSGAWAHYLILQVAVNTGMTPNATDASPFPAVMLVDWLRVDPL